MTTRTIRFGLFALAMHQFGCHSPEAKEPARSQESPEGATEPEQESRPNTTDVESTPQGTAPSNGGSCDDRPCSSTDDCCKGYACGFDPERSHVQRYCLPQ